MPLLKKEMFWTKTEILLVGLRLKLLTPLPVKPREHARDLGVILDSDVNFSRSTYQKDGL